MMQCRSSRHHGAVIPVKKYAGGMHLKTTHELLTKASNLQCIICRKCVRSAVTGPQKKQNMMIAAQRVSHPPPPPPPSDTSLNIITTSEHIFLHLKPSYICYILQYILHHLATSGVR